MLVGYILLQNVISTPVSIPAGKDYVTFDY